MMENEEPAMGWREDQQEYWLPSRTRMKRERRAYEEAEREDRVDEYII